MIVYYIANEEKPSSASGVSFFLDHAAAMDASSTVRGQVYSFEVNDKCDTTNFGMDTIMVFRRDDDGSLRFMASGQWVELHEILNVPFYYDFELRSKTLVCMSLKYFNSHYTVIEKKGNLTVKDIAKEESIEDIAAVIDELFIPDEPKKKKKKEDLKQLEQQDDLTNMLF